MERIDIIKITKEGLIKGFDANRIAQTHNVSWCAVVSCIYNFAADAVIKGLNFNDACKLFQCSEEQLRITVLLRQLLQSSTSQISQISQISQTFDPEAASLMISHLQQYIQ